jgi:hypothetical protein
MRFAGLLMAAVCAIAVAGCGSLSQYKKANEDSYSLWMAALKSYPGPVYYVGSDGDYSYFRAGGYGYYVRYKALTAKIHLPGTFPFGQGKPYLVTQDMVLAH